MFGDNWKVAQLQAMVACQRHRGPDGHATFVDASDQVKLGHDRLSILDLSSAGAQPMTSADGRFVIVFNGEIYNYIELRAELADYPFRTGTDTEVIIAAFEAWGEECLDRFLGMFALMIWDTRQRCLFAARDRFGVKPLYFSRRPDGGVAVSSEIRGFRAANVGIQPDPTAWATYLARGFQEFPGSTFWLGVESLPPGHKLRWRPGATVTISRWYDLASAAGLEFDERSDSRVEEEYLELLTDSVRLRFRSDVPVGINLSGGIDSSVLLGLVHAIQGPDSDVSVFTFSTNDSSYDELPWVRRMLERTQHRLVNCVLTAEQVPQLAISVQDHQDEPFGGIPTLAYARVFEEAHVRGVKVLLDGQGMDEQWAGYDYYRLGNQSANAPIVQGTVTSPVRPEVSQAGFCGAGDRTRSAAALSRRASQPAIPRCLVHQDSAGASLQRQSIDEIVHGTARAISGPPAVRACAQTTSEAQDSGRHRQMDASPDCGEARSKRARGSAETRAADSPERMAARSSFSVGRKPDFGCNGGSGRRLARPRRCFQGLGNFPRRKWRQQLLRMAMD